MMRRLLITCAAVAISVIAPSTAGAAGISFVPGSLEGTPVNQNGTPDLQAGSHPWAYNVHFAFKTIEGTELTEGGEVRQLVVELPPGLIGNPEAVPKCPRSLFDGQSPNCPPSTQVGVLHATITGTGEATGPVYNLEAPPGSAAQFGFNVAQYVSFQEGSVRTDDNYGVNVSAFNLPLPVVQATETIWGNPADPDHFSERFCRPNLQAQIQGCSSEAEQKAFLTLPAECQSIPQIRIKATSVLDPLTSVEDSAGAFSAGGLSQSLTGCESVPFSPSIVGPPTVSSTDSATGLDFELKLPDAGLMEPQALAETQPEKTEVVLPAGVTVNPSAANGIVACSLEQFGAATAAPGTGCPEASKVGTLVARTPLLDEPIEGAVYLAQPHENKFDSLLALYIVARVPARGILVKQAGLVQADQTTGQLTTTFDGLPPLPYSNFEFNLREGPRAALITPGTCGSYRTVARLYPFSAPGSAVERTAPFTVTSGAGGAPCAASEGAKPIKPAFEAGTTPPLAGAYSPFVFRVSRTDGEQRFSSVSATLPGGLLGRIAGVPYCSEAGISQASSRGAEGDGAKENASPSCPAASQVGTVTVSAGAGSQPYYVQGKAYLAGPYKGAPLSLEIITPAIAGPFDLGSVAVRTALYVNEVTAQIHAVSDPLPTILHGIPLDVRSISLEMSRPQFTLNPTNCEGKSVIGSIATLAGATAALSDPFAVGGCQGLEFKPSLKLAFTGATKRTGFPGVKAVLTQPKGQNANVAGATVILPKGMLIANAHINNPCTRVQFNSGAKPGEGCPAKSVLGTAKVWTPLLEGPEEGKVYFRSNGGERELPDLAVALHGQIPLQLIGFVDSVGKKGAEVRRVRSRFLNLPDAPVSRFELKLAGGKKGLLQNSKNLCKVSDKAKFQLAGQNGKPYDTEPKVQVKCPKPKKQKGGKKAAGK
jgi:hypothetical protein